MKEYSLRNLVKHLDYMYNFPDEHALTYRQYSDFLYKIYTQELEPLRQQAHDGKLTPTVHRLLTKAYQTAVLMAYDLGIMWPPLPKGYIVYEELQSFEQVIDSIENEIASIRRKLREIDKRLSFMKTDNGTDIRFDA